MSYTHPMGHNVVLVPSTETHTSSNSRSTPIDSTYDTEGIFIFEVSQASYDNEHIDMDIQVYESLTDDWYTIASFTQVESATTAQRELIKVPCGLGEKLSCKWTMTDGDADHKYTFTVSGVLK